MIKLPPGVRVRQALLESGKPGMFFEIARNGQCFALELPEPDALAIALAILGVSIEIRDTGGPR
jgi:hypothetical protein